MSATLSYLFYAHIPLLGGNLSSCSYFDNCTNRDQGMARATLQSAEGNLKQDMVCRDILLEIVLSSCLICWDGCVPNKQYVPPPFPTPFNSNVSKPIIEGLVLFIAVAVSPINNIQIHIEIGQGQISIVKRWFDTNFSVHLLIDTAPQ